MLEVLKIQNAAEQISLCQDCGVAYDPRCMAYRVKVDWKVLGIITFFMGAACGYLCDVKPLPDANDDNAFFIAARGTLDFMNRHGAEEAFFLNPASCGEPLAKQIGFAQKDGVWQMKLSGFFTEHKH
ncbi:MAG: hypothetical protein FWB93_00140 [Oscillospiraceae bacterium]|nr:hypothetical protein [Oscillospiraceae bacterium]